MLSAFVESPCKGCTVRKLHCHGTCSKYKEYLSKMQIIKGKIQAEKDEQAFFATLKSNLSKRHRRRDDA